METVVAKVLEVICCVLKNSKYYWGTGVIAAYFLLALFLLIINKRKNEKDRFISIYVFIIGVLYFFPVTAWIIMKCVGAEVYWRMFWLIPIPIIVAYVIVKQVDKINRKKIKVMVAIVSGVMLVIGGNFLYTKEIFNYNGNIYGVPQSTIDVCDAIVRDVKNRGISEYYVAASEEFSPWIRQYAPAIKMLYGRNGRKAKGKNNENIYEIYYMLSLDDTLEWDRLVLNIEKEKCDYLISIPSRISAQEAVEHGFRIVDQQENYIVLTLDG